MFSEEEIKKQYDTARPLNESFTSQEQLQPPSQAYPLASCDVPLATWDPLAGSKRYSFYSAPSSARKEVGSTSTAPYGSPYPPSRPPNPLAPPFTPSLPFASNQPLERQENDRLRAYVDLAAEHEQAIGEAWQEAMEERTRMMNKYVAGLESKLAKQEVQAGLSTAAPTADLNSLQIQLNSTTKQIATLKSQIASSTTFSRIAELETQLSQAQDDLASSRTTSRHQIETIQALEERVGKTTLSVESGGLKGRKLSTVDAAVQTIEGDERKKGAADSKESVAELQEKVKLVEEGRSWIEGELEHTKAECRRLDAELKDARRAWERAEEELKSLKERMIFERKRRQQVEGELSEMNFAQKSREQVTEDLLHNAAQTRLKREQLIAERAETTSIIDDLMNEVEILTAGKAQRRSDFFQPSIDYLFS
ncbi:hypothetical protein BCR35DRAFT_329997 [Leucosporidium creatinivorum]|uniref:Uncharacterized protein n=1 Tax=Leucosporidium creatinivorum TaxID=106004 RepID=A0A1Y2FWM9_9BASI|nr:hypothetical protein BCR35DRAFT_329997 [Leucosporidium creatinivorum]